MKKSIKIISIICVFIIVGLFTVDAVLADALFLMGEDVAHPSGFVLTVNEMTRKPFTTGLGGGQKRDEIRINLTMVNGGVRSFRINPLKDFSIDLSRRYSSELDSEGQATKGEFNLFPGTQTRVNLYFKVPQEETLAPIMVFSIDDSSVKILCDSGMQKLIDKASQGLSTEESIRLGDFYIEAGRFSQAKDIAESGLRREPLNSRLLLQMAAVSDFENDYESAGMYLQRIVPGSVTRVEDAMKLARQSFKLGQYDLTISILEPFKMSNRLDESELVTLGRAYYYNTDLDAAEQTLVELERNRSKNSLVYFTLGNIKEKENAYDKAIEYWRKTVELDPDYAEAYFNLGVGYLKLNDISTARECWSKVLLLNPDSQTLEATEEALKATDY